MKIMRLRHRRQAAEAEEGCRSEAAEDFLPAEVAVAAGNFLPKLRLRLARFASSLNVPVSTMSVGRSLCCALCINLFQELTVLDKLFLIAALVI